MQVITLRTASSMLPAITSRAGPEALVADRVGVGREDAAVVVGHAGRAHHVEIRLHDGVGRRPHHPELSPPAQHVRHALCPPGFLWPEAVEAFILDLPPSTHQTGSSAPARCGRHARINRYPGKRSALRGRHVAGATRFPVNVRTNSAGHKFIRVGRSWQFPTLRQELERRSFVSAPGVYDLISALIADRMGFKALYVTGYGTVASALGLPDAGLATYSRDDRPHRPNRRDDADADRRRRRHRLWRAAQCQAHGPGL